MASALVQSHGEYPFSTGAQFTGPVTAGHLLIAVMSSEGDISAATVTSTLNGTWTSAGPQFDLPIAVGPGELRIFYKENCSGGTETVSFNTAASDVGTAVYEFSGIVTSSSIDVQKQTFQNGNVTNPTSDAFTTTQQDLIFFCFADEGVDQSGGSPPFTAGTGYTLGENHPNHVDAQQYKTGVAAGSQSPFITLSTSPSTPSNKWGLWVIAFKEVVTASPFLTPDLPNPRGRSFPVDQRGFLNPSETQLIGRDKFFAAPGMGPAYDYPNPRGRAFPVELRTFLNAMETQLIRQDKFFGDAGQAPANLDWPVPKGKAFPMDLRTFTNAMEGHLIGKDQMFGAPGQPLQSPVPPNPIGPRFPSDLRTFLNPVESQLIGQDQFFGAPGQPLTYTWTVPSGPRASTDLRTWTQNLVESTLSLIVQSPFFLTDWPNPKGAQYSIALRTFIDSVKLHLLGKDQFFGAAGDPPTYDWPNPKGATYSIALRTFVDNLKLNLLNQDQFFGAAGQPLTYNWTNPVLPKVSNDLKSWQQNLLENTLALIIQSPFFLTDWPNPRGKQFPSDLRTFLNQVEIQLAGQDQFFGAAGQPPQNVEWVVPKGKRANDYTWLVNLIQSTLGNTVMPFSLDDWPNPLRPQDRTALQTFLSELLTTTLGGATPPPPFSMHDWPNPVRLQDQAALRTLFNQLKVQMLINQFAVRAGDVFRPTADGAVFIVSDKEK